MIVLQALYLMLPAYVANMAPVLFQFLPFLNIPIDHGKSLGGKRIFGNNKTYRGFLIGILAAIVMVFFQKQIFPYVKNLSLIPYDNYSQANMLLLGVAFGAGALLGDLIKSFFKRRLGISSGRLFFPFDQLDFVVGALLALSFFYVPSWPYIIIIFTVTPLLHFLTNVIGYLLRLKKVWW